MSKRSGSGRHGGVGQTTNLAPVPLHGVADEITARLVALPLDYGAAIDSVTALLVGDPRNEPHVHAVVTAIVATALTDPFREVNANQWRPAIPGWVRPPMVGVTVRQLAKAGLLVKAGRYVKSTDVRGGNSNKFCPIYALNLAALLPTEPDAAEVSARGA